ncbi:hypothetical protein D3C80_1226860 [compost metagenome]
MVPRQGQHPRGRLVLRRFRCSDVGEASMEQISQFDLARAAQIEDQRNMVEAGVPLHARGDRQGWRMLLPTPQHGSVERPLVQIVEGGIGRRRRNDLGARRRQGVGHGQETAIRRACRQNLQGRFAQIGRVQGHAVGGEGRLPHAELFFGDPGTRQLFQPQGGLGRVRRGRHRQIHVAALDLAGADHENRQVARRGGLPQPGHDRLPLQPAYVDDGGVDRHVLQHQYGRVQRPRRHRGPSQLIQPLAQRADQDVISSDDQYARIGIQKSLLKAWSARPRRRCSRPRR